jgi:hypothetical protein
MRGKGRAGGKCAPYAPSSGFKGLVVCGRRSTALLRRITHAAIDTDLVALGAKSFVS